MDAKLKIRNSAGRKTIPVDHATAMRAVLDIRTISDHFPGIGRYTYQLARALAHRTNRGELILLANRGSGTRFDLAALDTEPGARILYSTATPFSAGEQLRLPLTLRKISPSVTHFPYAVMPYAAPGPVVLTIHDIIPIRLPQFFTIGQRILYRALLSLALRKADAVICVSEATRSDLQSTYAIEPSRLFVVHEGIGESFRPCSIKEVEQVRSKYGLPKDYVLYVGSNKPHKNLPVLIEAFARLQTAPNLVIAGAPDPRFDRERCQADTMGIRDRIRFLGAMAEEELPALYSGARAFVFPSLYEGFGLPPLEAMACGVPVACSDIPSLRETTANAALFFDPRDCQSIACALERVVGDVSLRTDLRSRGMQRAAELSWDLAAQKTLAVYFAAINSGT